ncbi:hypothetical protein D3C80_1034650 [compost metagenome]
MADTIRAASTTAPTIEIATTAIMIAGIGVQIVATMGEIEGNGAIDAFGQQASTLSTGLVSDKRSSTTARRVTGRLDGTSNSNDAAR